MKNKDTKVVSFEKEQSDLSLLSKAIMTDKWFTPSTIIVNCMPEYSSRLVQSMNHGFSHKNNNQLLEIMDLAMPYPSYSQVWNPLSKNYESFDTYLKNWINEYVYPTNFLFVDVVTDCGRAFNKIKLSLRTKLENEQFRFASLYVNKDSILKPDYFVETYEQRPIFAWENYLNDNFKIKSKDDKENKRKS